MKESAETWKSWTPAESEIVKKYYPVGGSKLAIKHLDKAGFSRTIGAINQHAQKIKINCSRAKDASREEKIIRELYMDGKPQPRKRAAARLGLKINTISHIVRKAGITCRAYKFRKWTEFEVAMLEKHPEWPAWEMAKKLKKAGYYRTVSGIEQQRKKLGISGIGDWINPEEAGQLLGGFSGGTIRKWINDGLIKAKRRGYKSDADHHLITLYELRRFVEENTEKLRPRWAGIDPTFFVRELMQAEPPKRKKEAA